MLDLVGLDLGLRRDGGEGHGAVVRGPPEDRLRQRGQRDLHVQEIAVRFEEFVLGDVAGQDIVGRQIAAIECEEEVAEPGVRCFGQRVRDGM